MSSEGRDDLDAFFRMAGEFPVRTCIFTFGLPAFALLQLVNGIVYDGSLPFIGVFVILAVAYSIVVTRYHVAAYRRKTISSTVDDGW